MNPRCWTCGTEIPPLEENIVFGKFCSLECMDAEGAKLDADLEERQLRARAARSLHELDWCQQYFTDEGFRHIRACLLAVGTLPDPERNFAEMADTMRRARVILAGMEGAPRIPDPDATEEEIGHDR